MNIELGIKDTSKTLQFETAMSEDEAQHVVEQALSNGQAIIFTDTKNRRILVAADALAYATIGQEPKHTVGFGV